MIPAIVQGGLVYFDRADDSSKVPYPRLLLGAVGCDTLPRKGARCANSVLKDCIDTADFVRSQDFF